MADQRAPYAACKLECSEEVFVLGPKNERICYCRDGTLEERWSDADRIATALNNSAEMAQTS